MDVKGSILEAIGGTPLVRLNRVVPPVGSAEVLVKCEFVNPAGSIKDRMANYLIERAEQEGLLKPGGVIVENTSGNTGAGAAMVAAAKGYRAIFTMPDKMSKEKIDALRAFGAEVIITPTDVPGDSPDHYVNVAKRRAAETPGSFYLDQYHTEWNIEAHEATTGPELWEQTGGAIDAIVVGTGTGGTISGIGRYWKKRGSPCLIVGVDPLGSVHYNVFKSGEPSTPYVYKVEGLGEDIVCRAFDTSVVDEMHQVNDYECFHVSRRLIREEGLYCGGSSGGMVHIAHRVAERLGAGKRVVAVLPDSAGRYLTKYLDDEWMRMHGFMEPERGLGVIGDMLAGERSVVTANETDTVASVISLMRDNGVSQVPVVNGSPKPSGIVHEVDLLRGLQRGAVSKDSPVRDVESQIGGLVHPNARVEELYGVFAAGQAAIVVDGERVLGVLSQIDLIEHLAKRN
ncbi:MAG: pyridoxal-phosphate dependent enzyme [Planctomycetota bacterium]